MQESRLTGSRIRERRLVSGIRQADLARSVGISPAYLNLIEHNRRRIGGKLLVDLARELGAEPTSLTAGAEVAMLGAMRDAAAREPGIKAEVDRTEEFAGRFPGWAGLVAGQNRRLGELERLVETLSDRLTHDPHLAASLHDVLSTVTAIRSTASILTETKDIDQEWQARFLRNVGEDSARLSESAQGLVDYLDAGADLEKTHMAPQEELSAFLEAHEFHFAALEGATPAREKDIVARADLLKSDASKSLAMAYLTRYAADAARLPLDRFRNLWRDTGRDPAIVAAQMGVDPAMVLRRVASLPAVEGGEGAGLVICDGSGTLTFRQPVAGFALPRFGAACPLWPLFQALSRPAQPVKAHVEMPGGGISRFICMAISQASYPAGFEAPPVYEATMLILPETSATSSDDGGFAVGTSCRICPRDECAARREPSILSGRA